MHPPPPVVPCTCASATTYLFLHFVTDHTAHVACIGRPCECIVYDARAQVENLRKLALNGMVLFVTRDADRLLAVIIISALFMATVIVFFPYRLGSDNKVQSAFLAQVLWTTLGAVAFRLNGADPTSLSPTAIDIGYSIIGGSILIGVLLLYWAFEELYVGVRESFARAMADRDLASAVTKESGATPGASARTRTSARTGASARSRTSNVTAVTRKDLQVVMAESDGSPPPPGPALVPVTAPLMARSGARASLAPVAGRVTVQSGAATAATMDARGPHNPDLESDEHGDANVVFNFPRQEVDVGDDEI
jgi:hypothetical protein